MNCYVVDLFIGPKLGLFSGDRYITQAGFSGCSLMKYICLVRWVAP